MALTIAAPADERAHTLAHRLNWLRAGVLGANDGIISTAGLVFGVAGATSDATALLIAGLAGLVAGSLSMAGGEYVSVSSQRDTEIAALARLESRLATDPVGRRHELADHYAGRGLPPELAGRVADALSDSDALGAQALDLLGVEPGQHVSPVAAARASLLAFVAGAVIPLMAMVASPPTVRLQLTLVAVLSALTLTGLVSARLGGARSLPAVARNVVVGCLAMGLTFAVGSLVGQQL